MSTATMRQNQANPYQQPVEEVLTAFDTDARRGLSKEEARARLEKYGKNELTAGKPVPAWRKFFAQSQDVLVILLLIATLISTVLWLYERESALPYEAMAIFAVVLLVLDASLPGGLIEGYGNMRYAQTMAFTTLMLFQIFNVFNARSDERSAFAGLFSNKLLWGAVLLSLALQVAVIYTPFLQQTFSTVGLSFDDWLRCAAVASSVLWLRELGKVIARTTSRGLAPNA